MSQIPEQDLQEIAQVAYDVVTAIPEEASYPVAVAGLSRAIAAVGCTALISTDGNLSVERIDAFTEILKADVSNAMKVIHGGLREQGNPLAV